jgi:hypothetical protein
MCFVYSYNCIFIETSTSATTLPPLDEANNAKLAAFYNNMDSPGSSSGGCPQDINIDYASCNIR